MVMMYKLSSPSSPSTWGTRRLSQQHTTCTLFPRWPPWPAGDSVAAFHNSLTQVRYEQEILDRTGTTDPALLRGIPPRPSRHEYAHDPELPRCAGAFLALSRAAYSPADRDARDNRPDF